MKDSELLIAITNATTSTTKVNLETILSGRRNANIADAKRLISSIACDFEIKPEITAEYLNCDRCTILYLDNRCFELESADKKFKQLRDEIMAKLFDKKTILAHLKK